MLAKAYLFVPGDSEKKLEKASSAGAGALILCLEDAVAEANKARARAMVAEYLQSQPTRATRLWVRVNPISTPHLLDDLVAVMRGRPDGLFFPKPSCAADFVALAHYVTALEVQNGIARGATKLMSVVESAVGALHQHEFAQATPRLAALTWGAEDMSADIGATTNIDESGAHFLLHQMNRANALLIAAAGNMQAVDGICADFRNLEKLRAECVRARREGFSGKIAIHPDQVATINECFAPTTQEIAYAQRVVDAFAQANGAGTVGLDGRMLDLPHLKQAQRTLSAIKSLASNCDDQFSKL